MMSDTPLQLRNQSVFAPYISDFVAQKQALGLKYNVTIETLNLFDSFCVEAGVTEAAITEELYADWCKKRPAENETTHQLRVGCVRRLSIFMHDNGLPAIAAFHPLPKKSKAFTPYIFSKDEINRLLDSVDSVNSVRNPGSPIRHLVHPVLFRVLYGCGLRANEALKLKTKDVNLETGAITVRMAKGGKDRMVVMSDSLLENCRAYRSNPEVMSFGSEYFFPAKDRGYYDSSTIYADFRKYLKLSGIAHRGRGNGPRLHDLRHTFAVHVLNSWSEQGKDLYVCLPILQQYMGHKNITATEQYLRLVPDAYSNVTGQFTSVFADIFPEVQDEEK